MAAEAASEVRIGFIGCGGNARGHMRRLGQVPGARIVGVCDISTPAVEAASEQTGAEAYQDYRRMLERQDLDAVYLSIPVFAHGEPEMAVIERELPMFVEKPVAIDLGTAKQVAAAVQRAGLLTCVGYQLRYCGSADVARELLSAPEAGPVGLATGTYWCGTGRSQGPAWRTQMAQSGGHLGEQATHTIDMMRSLVGEVAEVSAFFGKQILREGHGDSPDSYAVALRFENGAVGTIAATWAIDPTDWSMANWVDLAYGDRRLHWRIGGVTVAGGGEAKEITRPDGSIDEVFVDAVRRRDGSAIRSDYAEGVRSLAVSLAANESANTGAPIKVA